MLFSRTVRVPCWKHSELFAVFAQLEEVGCSEHGRSATSNTIKFCALTRLHFLAKAKNVDRTSVARTKSPENKAMPMKTAAVQQGHLALYAHFCAYFFGGCCVLACIFLFRARKCECVVEFSKRCGFGCLHLVMLQ